MTQVSIRWTFSSNDREAIDERQGRPTLTLDPGAVEQVGQALGGSEPAVVVEVKLEQRHHDLNHLRQMSHSGDELIYVAQGQAVNA